MLNSKDRGKCRNSSGKRFRISSDRRLKVGNFRPISRATPSSLRLFTTPGNLIGDGTRYTSVSRILIIQGGIIFSLSFSLSNCREFERNSKHFLSSTCHVRNGERNGIRKFRKLRKLREFSRIIDRIEKLVFIFVKEGWEDWIKKKSMLWSHRNHFGWNIYIKNQNVTYHIMNQTVSVLYIYSILKRAEIYIHQ